MTAITVKKIPWQPHQTLMLLLWCSTKIYFANAIDGDADTIVRGRFGTNRMNVQRL